MQHKQINLEQPDMIKYKIGFLFSMLFFSMLFTFGQKEIKETDKIVFCYVENRLKNFIVIPNFRGKLYNFEIYRKLKSESEFKLIVSKKKPAIPLRTNHPSVYSVQWEDPDYHSRDVDYKILCYDKKGNEHGEMQIIWEEEKGKSKKQAMENDTLKK
jgi:hypothetical protein